MPRHSGNGFSADSRCRPRNYKFLCFILVILLSFAQITAAQQDDTQDNKKVGAVTSELQPIKNTDPQVSTPSDITAENKPAVAETDSNRKSKELKAGGLETSTKQVNKEKTSEQSIVDDLQQKSTTGENETTVSGSSRDGRSSSEATIPETPPPPPPPLPPPPQPQEIPPSVEQNPTVEKPATQIPNIPLPPVVSTNSRHPRGIPPPPVFPNNIARPPVLSTEGPVLTTMSTTRPPRPINNQAPEIPPRPPSIQESSSNNLPNSDGVQKTMENLTNVGGTTNEPDVARGPNGENKTINGATKNNPGEVSNRIMEATTATNVTNQKDDNRQEVLRTVNSNPGQRLEDLSTDKPDSTAVATNSWITWVIVGVISGIIVISLAIIFFAICRRRRLQRDSNATAVHPKRVSSLIEPSYGFAETASRRSLRNSGAFSTRSSISGSRNSMGRRSMTKTESIAQGRMSGIRSSEMNRTSTKKGLKDL